MLAFPDDWNWTSRLFNEGIVAKGVVAAFAIWVEEVVITVESV